MLMILQIYNFFPWHGIVARSKLSRKMVSDSFSKINFTAAPCDKREFVNFAEKIITAHNPKYMKRKLFRYIAATVMAGLSLLYPSSSQGAARVHCDSDTATVSRLLASTAAHGGTLGERCVFVARSLEGTPWAPPADNDSTGTIVVDMHGFDRPGFVNNVLAIASASFRNLPTVRDYEMALENYSRRKGEDSGFASQLIYGADWIVDNVYRGNLKEMTEYVTGGSFKTKTLDHVTRHADEYPALKDSVVLDKVRMVEMGYRSHRIPHLKKQSAGNKPLHDLMQDGDIIMMLSPETDYDVYDIGFVEMRDGVPYLIHITHDTGKVTADTYPLSRLFKLEGQHFYGYRWLRPQD